MIKKIATAVLFVMAISPALAQSDPIVTESTNTNTNTNNSTSASTSVNNNTNTNKSYSDSNSTSTVKSPPPTAVAPAVTTINNDVCAVVASGAVQTQIFGFSMGGTMRDMNCERIKLSKNLFDMGMKVAAVATLCQDERVFAAMIAAGTPCPIEGKIGAQAREEWDKRELNSDGQHVGFYSSKPRQVTETKEPQIVPATTTNCSAYSGNDPIVIARVCK
jgi:hypothetical protein